MGDFGVTQWDQGILLGGERSEVALHVIFLVPMTKWITSRMF
jgi:hypothetical protein